MPTPPAPGSTVGIEAATGRMLVPPWVQFVGLPLLVLFGWLFASAASHAVIVFLISGLISLLLNPIVRSVSQAGAPRPIAVLLVFSAFALIITVLVVAAVNTTVTQAERVRENLPEIGLRVEQKIDDAQGFVDARGWKLDLRDQGVRFFDQIEEKSSELSRDALDFGREFVTRVAEATFNMILVMVITIYMLLDAPRIARLISGTLPKGSDVEPLFLRLEDALLNYVRGQTLASLVMGASAAVGLWVIGVTGIWPAAAGLALTFGIIVAITEFAPSIGPVLGSIPPLVAASFDGFVPVIVVFVFFLVLHQIEGHIVVPKLMGAAIAVHPLLVIFGIIAGAQIMGPAGIILVLPLLAVGREILVFLHERVGLEPWPHEHRELPAGAVAAATVGARVGDATAAGHAGSAPFDGASLWQGTGSAWRRMRTAVTRRRWRGGGKR